jgi:alpha-L-fucosidase
MTAARHINLVRLAVSALLALAVSLGGLVLGGSAFGYGGEPGSPVIAVSASVAPPGGTLTVEGREFTPHGRVDLSLHSTVVELGRVMADGQGRFSTHITVPATEAPGQHLVEALDEATGDVATATITVVSAPSGVAPPPSSHGGLAGTGVAVLGLLVVGLVLLASGATVTSAGRRRVRPSA